MKYRLVIDHTALTDEPWHKVEKQATEGGRWALVCCGYAPSCHKVFDHLTNGGQEIEELAVAGSHE